MQSPGQSTVGEGGNEDHQIHTGSTSRELVPQETYTPLRPQRELEGSLTIEFSARGERGICLSDALEGNWGSLEKWDDRPFSGDDRVAIILRMHARPFAIVRP